MTLTDFLLARIAEDEEQARLAIAKRDSIAYVHAPVVPDMALEAFEDIGVPAVIVGPERVLAECEAKRGIVEACTTEVPRIGQRPEDYTRVPTDRDDILRILALPYADHPDYREEWKP